MRVKVNFIAPVNDRIRAVFKTLTLGFIAAFLGSGVIHRSVAAQNPNDASRPNPLRDGVQPASGPMFESWVQPSAPPHLVLEPPTAVSPGHHGVAGDHHIVAGHHPAAGDEVVYGHSHAGTPEMVLQEDYAPASHGGSHPSKLHAHGEHLKNQFLHGDKRERPPAIPSATRMPVWKTPYSYGHFGASHQRQWTLHRGYKNNYTQWTLR